MWLQVSAGFAFKRLEKMLSGMEISWNMYSDNCGLSEHTFSVFGWRDVLSVVYNCHVLLFRSIFNHTVRQNVTCYEYYRRIASSKKITTALNWTLLLFYYKIQSNLIWKKCYLQKDGLILYFYSLQLCNIYSSDTYIIKYIKEKKQSKLMKNLKHAIEKYTYLVTP